MKHKVVVFDVDETLGNFIQFSLFGHALEDYFNQPGIMYRYFNDLVDLYPEIIRPNMVRILDYIRKKKNAGVCSKVMIYTNNMGPDKWVAHIRQYFESKLRDSIQPVKSISGNDNGIAIIPPLFDHTIGGFNPNKNEPARRISGYPERTTSEKTVKEFIRCSRLPSDIDICFLDDLEHPKMVDERVYYIKLQAYHSFIPFEMFVVRFLNSALYRNIFDKLNLPSVITGTSIAAKKQIISIELYNVLMRYVEMSDYDERSIHQKVNPREIDEIISKYILYHLQQFFKEGPPQNSYSLRSSSRSRVQIRKTSKKNVSTRSASSNHNGHIFYVDKNTAVKNMKNTTMRKR
jgi:hypothetical protein